MANPGRNALVRLLVVPGLCVVAIVYLKYCGWGGGHHDLDQAHAEHTAEGYRHYVEFGGDPDDVRDDLAELHASAIAHATAVGAPNPAGLNALLPPLLQRVDNRVRFVGSDFHVDATSFDDYVATLGPADDAAPHLPGSLDQMQAPEIASVPHELRELYGCPQGLTLALAAVTGNDVIAADDDTFKDVDGPLPDVPRIELHVTATASGTAFVAQMSRKIVPGVRLTGYALVVGGDGVPVRIPVDVSPPEHLSFTTLGLTPFGADSGDMLMGISKTLCSEIGLAIDQQLVGWAPSLDSLGSDAGSGSGARGHAR
jgi:hypothetical protein|nr:hypothetical protein [Kofleriaceae bacterium]